MKWLIVAMVVASCSHTEGPSSEPLELYTAGATANERLPLIVLLHGYGGSPQHIVHILDGLGVRARVIAPHGLFRVDHGWGWFALLRQSAPDALAPGITHAADVVAQQIATEVRTRPTCGLPVVVGFSQGGFLSYALAMRTPAVVSAAFPLSGFLPPSLRARNKPADAPRIVAYHGDADDVVSTSLDHETNKALSDAGFTAELHTYPGVGHQVPPPIANDVRAAIERAVHDSGCAS
jgi:phospholipase/carboxylesterase